MATGQASSIDQDQDQDAPPPQAVLKVAQGRKKLTYSPRSMTSTGPTSQSLGPFLGFLVQFAGFFCPFPPPPPSRCPTSTWLTGWKMVQHIQNSQGPDGKCKGDAGQTDGLTSSLMETQQPPAVCRTSHSLTIASPTKQIQSRPHRMGNAVPPPPPPQKTQSSGVDRSPTHTPPKEPHN